MCVSIAIAALLTCFTVFEARGAARYCAPGEHALAALFICPPGVPQILGCTATRDFQQAADEEKEAPEQLEQPASDQADSSGGDDESDSIYAPGSDDEGGEATLLTKATSTERAQGRRRRELLFF